MKSSTYFYNFATVNTVFPVYSNINVEPSFVILYQPTDVLYFTELNSFKIILLPKETNLKNNFCVIVCLIPRNKSYFYTEV